MSSSEVKKYSKAVRILHWVHSGAFVLLFLTGLTFFVPALSFLAGSGWAHFIHRIAAVLFVAAPIIYLIIKPKAAGRGIRLAFTWGKADAGWLKAAPGYYFTGNTSGMPPQGFLNAGQKLWWLLTLVFGVIFAGTGSVMWFAKSTAAPGLLQQMVASHDVSLIVVGCMFLLHLYLGLFHPASTEALRTITAGRISAAYAKSHHGGWYAGAAPLDKPPRS